MCSVTKVAKGREPYLRSAVLLLYLRTRGGPTVRCNYQHMSVSRKKEAAVKFKLTFQGGTFDQVLLLVVYWNNGLVLRNWRFLVHCIKSNFFAGRK